MIRTNSAVTAAVALTLVCAVSASGADDPKKKKKKGTGDQAAATAPADNSAASGDLGKSDDRGPSKVAAPADTPTPTTKADELEKAEAEKDRKAREARVPTVVQEAERQKIDTKITGQDLGQDAYQRFRRQIELKAGKARLDLIGQLDKIIASNPPEDEKPDLLFQKAELLREEAQQHFFNGMGMDDGIAAALTSGDDKKVLDLQAQKEKELAEQKNWENQATKLYETIEKKYPKYERMPDVLYSLGQTYWDRTQYQDALKVYRRLIKEYPKAQYIPDAWLAFGEYYFQVGPDEEKDVKKALEAYEKAAADTNAAVYPYATYKQ